MSTSAGTITSLAAGKYWVRLEGPAVVVVNAAGTAAIPSSGSAAASGNKTLAHGETYVHALAANLSVIGHSSGHLWLQPVSRSG